MVAQPGRADSGHDRHARRGRSLPSRLDHAARPGLEVPGGQPVRPGRDGSDAGAGARVGGAAAGPAGACGGDVRGLERAGPADRNAGRRRRHRPDVGAAGSQRGPRRRGGAGPVAPPRRRYTGRSARPDGHCRGLGRGPGAAAGGRSGTALATRGRDAAGGAPSTPPAACRRPGDRVASGCAAPSTSATVSPAKPGTWPGPAVWPIKLDADRAAARARGRGHARRRRRRAGSPSPAARTTSCSSRRPRRVWPRWSPRWGSRIRPTVSAALPDSGPEGTSSWCRRAASWSRASRATWRSSENGGLRGSGPVAYRSRRNGGSGSSTSRGASRRSGRGHDRHRASAGPVSRARLRRLLRPLGGPRRRPPGAACRYRPGAGPGLLGGDPRHPGRHAHRQCDARAGRRRRQRPRDPVHGQPAAQFRPARQLSAQPASTSSSWWAGAPSSWSSWPRPPTA